jgi:PAS domain S-box-containing protein
LLDEIVPQNKSFQDFEVDHTFENIGRRVMLLNARRISRDVNHTDLILLAIEDITERRQAERGLRESEERFRLMVEGVRDHAIILFDTNGRVVAWNEGAQRVLGYDEKEIIGQPMAVFFTPEDRQSGRAERELREAISTGRAGDDNWLVRKNGSRFWASGATSLLRNESGELRGFVKILRDLTERKQLEEALRERAEQLAQADRNKDEFLAMLAHELRNPLAPLRNALHLVRLADPNPRPQIQDARDVMERQIEQLVRLVDDLLDVSRITRGKIRLQFERVDLLSIISRAIESSRPLIDARNHVLETVVPRETVLVDADPVRLAQVFLNLLTNAAKYTPEGGRIRLAVECSDSMATVRVRDTGIGIAAEVLPKVFELFTQAERSLDRSEGGLGIGLTLVRRLAEMHGGSVEAFSEGPGRGSEFAVHLPTSPTALAASTSDSLTNETGRVSSSPRRILVVDDNRDSAESLAMLLRLLGNDVRTAYDGRLCLEIAVAYRPDVVLLDIGLPGLNGFEVCQRLRGDGNLKSAMIVAMTGYGQDEDKRRSHESGFDAHLIKPVDLEVLRDLLDRPELAVAR